MHHIATIIFSTSPTPSVDDLMELVASEFPDAEVNEAEDGFEIGLDESTLYVEVEVPDAASVRTIDDDDEADDDEDAAYDEEADEEDALDEDADPDEIGADDEDEDGGGAVLGDDEDDEDDEVAGGAVTMMLHFEGDFEDLADVIGVLEVIVASADGITVVDADGEPFPLPE